MTKVTLRQVVGAVAQVRGRRGARLRDIVDCVVEQVHWRAVGRTLQSLVSSGTLQRRGKRFRLAPRRRTSPQFVTRKRRGPVRYTTRDRRGRRKRRCRVSSEDSLCVQHLRQPKSCYTLVGSSSSRKSSRTSSESSIRCSVCRKERSSSAGSSDSDLTVNRRLASTRDSVEILKERLSSRSTQVGGSSGASAGAETSVGAETAAPSSYHWMNHQLIMSSVDTLPPTGAARTASSVDSLQPTATAHTVSGLDTLQPSVIEQTEASSTPPATKRQKFCYFPWT